MSSPRQPFVYKPLDPNTYGDSPAALYLVELLNKRQDPLLNRKVSRTLAEGRELVSSLAKAHLDYDALSTRSLARMLTLVSQDNQTRAADAVRAHDEHIANLVVNILEGGVKTWKRRVEKARRLEKSQARHLAPGTPVEWVPAMPLADETTSTRLQERSKRYLARKGKVDTLY